jgi:hypothetical protein
VFAGDLVGPLALDVRPLMSCIKDYSLARSDRSGSTSQSMQRNLRPPVFTSINCIGLPHLEHIGDGGFLGIYAPLGLGGSAKLSVTDNYQNEAAMIDCAPFFCGLRGNSKCNVIRPLTC